VPHSLSELNNPQVCCVVVNWNGWQDTLPCLASLTRQLYSNLHVIVVDNGSTDGSIERVRAAYPQVTLLETGKNLGFAAGCNVGIREALLLEPEFVWLLNNDTICPPDTIGKLVRKALDNPGDGIVGSVLYYEHDPSQVQAWGGGKLLPWLAYAKHFRAPASFGRDTFVTFASALIRREVLEEIGMLYEGFFLYYEDADFCQRMQRTRWKMVVAEDTDVLHKEGASRPAGRSFFIEKTNAVSGLRFIRRNVRPFWLAGPFFIFAKLANRARLHEGKAIKAVLAGVLEYRRESPR
jgi:GT2 family glycosyltransferase